MVTITLHDKDAQELLNALDWIDSKALTRAQEAIRCALLLCDCDKARKEKE